MRYLSNRFILVKINSLLSVCLQENQMKCDIDDGETSQILLIFLCVVDSSEISIR
jgi:hypothetical protein